MPSLPAPFALLDLIQGSMVTQAIYAAAELGIADALADGPLTAPEVARRIGAHPDTTHRLLRTLASYSLFIERGDGRFELAPMGDALRADAPVSMRNIALLMGHPIHWEDWGHFTETVRTGEPSVPKVRGMSAWEYFGADPEYGNVFFQGMGNLSELETDAVAAAYDFSRYGTIVDVAGGSGALLSAILAKATASRGVLFAPGSEEVARDVLAQGGVADRTVIESGFFLDGVPSGGDAYILKHVLHDWPEAQALQILRNVRSAIKPGGRLLIMEFVLPEGGEPFIGKLVDLWLMLLVGGKERTAKQYSELLAEAGFRLASVTPTRSDVSIVEAEAV